MNTPATVNASGPIPAAAPASQRLAVSADEVAAMLGISRAHLFRLKSSGRLPRPVVLGRSVRWDLATLQAWLAAGARTRDRWEELHGAPGGAKGARR